MKLIYYIIAVLFFVVSCKKNTTPSQNYSYTTSGNTINMSGTWVLYQYQLQNSSSIISKSDTLIFSSNNNYTYNKLNAKYYLDNFNLYTNYRLILYNTAFGNITALIPDNFENTKEINGVLFSPYLSSNTGDNKYLIWLKKI